MRILIINPNTTASMTQAIAAAARDAAAAGTEIVAVNPESGPASIQGAEDGEAALPGLYEVFDHHVSGPNPPDAVVIACFDDTGLMELRVRSPVPVTGIGEAAYLQAIARAAPFSVVTTLAVSVPVLESNIETYGLSGNCARVRASGVPVLALESDPDAALKQIEHETAAALTEDGCLSIVLGCAGMADLADRLERKFGLPVVEGVRAAVAWCQREVGTA